MTATSSLTSALDALEQAALAAGVDPSAARREGEELAAAVAEPAKAFPAWCEQTGRPRSSEAFFDAVSRGRRHRNGPTPSMQLLALNRSPHAPAYAEALGDVALAAAELAPNPTSAGYASMAATAQLAEPSPARTPVPTLGDEVARSLTDQLAAVHRKLANLGAPVPTGGFETGASAPSSTTDDATPVVEEGRSPVGPVVEEGRSPVGPVVEEGRSPVSKPPLATAPADPPPEPEAEPEPEEEPKSVEELLAELDALVGLTEVKAEIHRQAAVLRVEGLRRDAGLRSPTITRHLIFNGNPGTGKTTVARLVAGIYRALGLLSKGQLVEVDRSELVAGYLGQTATKTVEVVASAEGGVLFIDEAYSLAGDQYGQEAVDTLVKEMEDKRDDLVVIVAGYPVPMEVFIAQNPGLESRFRTTIDFPDYTDDELVDIFAMMASGAEYDADDGVLDRLRELLVGVRRGSSFGNARYVRNVLEAAVGRHAWRLRDVDEPTLEQLRTLEPDDLDAVEPLEPPTDDAGHPPDVGVVDLDPPEQQPDQQHDQQHEEQP